MKSRVLQALVGVLALVAYTLVAQAAPGNSKMSDRAREVLENHPNDWVDLIVTYKQRPTAADRGKVANIGVGR